MEHYFVIFLFAEIVGISLFAVGIYAIVKDRPGKSEEDKNE